MSKRKLIKIIFHAFVLASTILPIFLYLEQYPNNPKFFYRTFFLSLVLIPFYVLNTFYLVFEFLKKGKYITYIVLIFLSIIFFGLVVNFSIYRSSMESYTVAKEARKEQLSSTNTQDQSVYSRETPQRKPRRTKKRRFRYPFFIFPLIMITALGTSFEIILDWDQQRRRNKEIEVERISAELSFLKSQMNPHFIFNTLNNIYSMAAVKSDDTEKAILLLSNMMRYVLYESSADKIPIRKEIQLIEDYIALQRIRISDQRNVDIQFNYDQKLNALLIEPMIFLPLIENAFKHGISYQEESYIHIALEYHQTELHLKVENTKPKLKTTPNPTPDHRPSGGIGLHNIQKRLLLSYPKNHYLSIQDEEEVFRIHLSLNLQQS